MKTIDSFEYEKITVYLTSDPDMPEDFETLEEIGLTETDLVFKEDISDILGTPGKVYTDKTGKYESVEFWAPMAE